MVCMCGECEYRDGGGEGDCQICLYEIGCGGRREREVK